MQDNNSVERAAIVAKTNAEKEQAKREENLVKLNKQWLHKAICGSGSLEVALNTLIKNLEPLNGTQYNALELAQYLVDHNLQGLKTASSEAVEIWATILGKDCFVGYHKDITTFKVKCLCGEHHRIRKTRNGWHLECYQLDMFAKAYSQPTLVRSFIRMQIKWLYDEGNRRGAKYTEAFVDEAQFVDKDTINSTIKE